MTIDDLKIEHQILPLNSMTVSFSKPLKSCKSKSEILKHTNIATPDGRIFKVSNRFWESFCSLHNLSMSIFEYFDHAEVFSRITAVRGANVRISTEKYDGDPVETILSCTNPSKPVVKINEINELIEKFDGDKVNYGCGVAQVSFPAPFPINYQIAGDDFTTRFNMQIPVDGYGLPSAYLELHRIKSYSTIMGYSKAFKTQFQLGKDDNSLYLVLDRAMRTFNNEEGYHSFKVRLEAAAKSWASFHEAGTLHALLSTVMANDGLNLPDKLTILKKFNETTGNPLAYYGVTGSNELSQRKARTIPVNATVYDLINFATEITIHYIKNRDQKQRLAAWIGGKLTDEYDLEGTVTTTPEFKGFFIETTKSLVESDGSRILQLDDPSEPLPVVPDGVTSEDAPPSVNIDQLLEIKDE